MDVRIIYLVHQASGSGGWLHIYVHCL